MPEHGEPYGGAEPIPGCLPEDTGHAGMVNQPPPPPAQNQNKTWIIVGVCVAVFLLVAVGLVVAGGIFVQRQIAKRQALTRLEQSAAAEREKIAESLRSGNSTDADAAVGRLKDQLGEFANKSGGTDADVSRAMSRFLGKMQAGLQDYTAANEKLQGANILEFKMSERAQIEDQRKIVREFLASNDRFAKMLAGGEAAVRAELTAANIPAKVREATIGGYTRSQSQLLPLQVRIRACDKAFGEATLSLLDLLDKNWGKWKRDDATGMIRFEDDKTLSAFNADIEKIQTAGADQAKAQEELIAKSAALQKR
jgi:hypothetical protein